MAYFKMSDFVFDCKQCHTRCDGRSKGVYLFENDATFSEEYEQLVINRVNGSSLFRAHKSVEPGYPDIEVVDLQGSVRQYLEVKVQQRTFMSVERILPLSKLSPSETVALNLSDLLRYFKVEADTGIPVNIIWFVMNRLCLIEEGGKSAFYQTAKALKMIYEEENLRRKFTRKSGDGDVVEGIHKGVTVNYHFSLKELIPWKM